MSAWSVLVLCLTASLPVEVTTLKGEPHVGSLERLNGEEAVLKTPGGAVSVPAAELLAIRVPGATASPAVPDQLIELRLTDGSKLRVTGFTSTGTEAAIEHPQLGSLKMPMTAVHSVRFAAPDAKVDATWSQLLDRTPKKDQVAVKKGDVLDHLDGVIGSLDGASLKFQLDGDEIPVKRERIFGLIYAKRENLASRAVASVELLMGDRLAAKTVSFEGDAWKVKLVSGAEVSIAASQTQTVDFSLGKIAYLSNLEPRDVKYTPFFDFVWEYRRDRSLDGKSISLGNKTYAKGLAIHSLTVMKYRLGGDYRRFQAVMGIDDDIRVAGNVDVIIKGDGRPLFKGAAKVNQPPQPLDLDVTGVVELEITVDYGDDKLDIGDRLHLADAKVVK